MSITKITERKAWEAFLKKVSPIDCYHTYDYHSISKKKDETAVLFAYESGEQIIGLPLLIRPIPGTDYFDATSVWGYAGPVYKNIHPDFDTSAFKKELLEILKQDRVISVFARLHPFLDQQKNILCDLGSIECKGMVVNIDLQLSLEEQRQQYQKRLKTYVNKARRSCKIQKVEDKEAMGQFKEIYYEGMRRVNASEFYFFDDPYFDGITGSDQFETETFLARDLETGIPIGGCMFIKCHPFIQYHLSGLKETHQHLNPTKLLIDEMRIKATKQGYLHYILGGGLSGSSEDSLFKFKSSFSKDFHAFCLWKWVVIPDIYERLCKEYRTATKDGFFPAYRS